MKRGRLFALTLLLGLQSVVAIWQAPDVGAATGSVVINEIQPGTGSVQKFIELYNRGTEPVDISGWKFARGASNLSPVIPTGTPPLAPGQFYTYTTTSSLPLDGGVNALRLLAKTGDEQDSKAYSVTTPGNSLARIPDGSDSWQESVPTIGHTNLPMLSAPQQMAPTDMDVLNNKSIQFSWSPVVDAESYRLQIARTSDFAVLLVDRSKLDTEPLTLDFADEGDYFWRVAGVAQKAESTWSTTRGFTIDTAAPTIAIAPAPSTTLNGIKTITASASDSNPASVTMSVNESCGSAQPSSSLPASASLTLITPAGLYGDGCRVMVVAVDAAGNRTEKSYGYTIDNQPPRLELGSIEKITSDTLINGAFNDQSGIAGYTISLRDGSGTTIGQPRRVENSGEISFRLRDFGAALANGSYQFVLQATDSLGNQTTAIVKDFMLENTLGSMNPTIVASSPNASNSTVITLSGQTLGSVAITTVRILDGTDRAVIATLQVVDGQWSYQIAAPTSGIYRYIIEATDENGNVIEYERSQLIAPFLAPTTTIDTSLIAPLRRTSALRTIATPTMLSTALQRTNTVASRAGSITAITPVVDAMPPTDNGVVVTPTPEGWKVFGVTWYWWLLGLVVLSVAFWSIGAVNRRRRNTTNL